MDLLKDTFTQPVDFSLLIWLIATILIKALWKKADYNIFLHFFIDIGKYIEHID